jgi:transcription antitermination factor NusG
LLRDAWFAVYTAPRREKAVHARLMAKQIRSFLPFYTAARRWRNRVRREIQHPLWPGYLFVSFDVDERVRVLQTAGVLHIVGNGSSPLLLDDHEMDALRISGQCASLRPHPFLFADNTVCIKRGPLQGLEGYVEKDGCDLRFVVNIHLIQRSYSISVQASDLASVERVEDRSRVMFAARSLVQA